MDYTLPYSYEVAVVPLTSSWTDGEPLSGIIGCTVERDITDDAPTLESCDLTLASDAPTGFSGWARVDVLAHQSGGSERMCLGCYRFEADSAKFDSGSYELNLTGYSVLKPLDEYIMAVGSYAPYGTDGAAWCANLMAEAGVPSPVAVGALATIPENVVFDDDTTALEAVWGVLGRCSLTIRIDDGDGTVNIVPEPTAAALTLDRTGAHGMQPDVEVKAGELSYTREFDPATRVGDLVRVDLPSLGISGTYRSASQSIDLASGLAVEETLEAWNG